MMLRNHRQQGCCRRAYRDVFTASSATSCHPSLVPLNRFFLTHPIGPAKTIEAYGLFVTDSADGIQGLRTTPVEPVSRGNEYY